MEFSSLEPSTSDFEVPDFGTCNFGMVIPRAHREIDLLSYDQSQVAESLELQSHNHKIVLIAARSTPPVCLTTWNWKILIYIYICIALVELSIVFKLPWKNAHFLK